MVQIVDKLNESASDRPVWAVCLFSNSFEHAEHLYYRVADAGFAPILVRFERERIAGIDPPRPGRLTLGYLIGLVLGLIVGILFPWLAR